MASVRKSPEEIALEEAKRICRKAGLWVSQKPPTEISCFVEINVHEIKEMGPGPLGIRVERAAANMLGSELLKYAKRTETKLPAEELRRFSLRATVIPHVADETGENE